MFKFSQILQNIEKSANDLIWYCKSYVILLIGHCQRQTALVSISISELICEKLSFCTELIQNSRVLTLDSRIHNLFYIKSLPQTVTQKDI